MSPIEVKQFLRAAKKIGERWYLAFRLYMNAMLRARELTRLTERDIARHADGILAVDGVEVRLDCDTLQEIERWRGARTGRLFPGYYTVRKAFRKAIKLGNVYEYTMHALRHTGIMIRAREVRTPADLEDLRKMARFRRTCFLRPYLGAEESKLIERVKFVK
ncbi:MAG: hypothetical protein A3E01_10260 [Gammaproteobacteria bacterium RIFCSPHIGHO2_12_FULL_63_22]|nr:MAG: hypothetical protein A3E01_10260 [Gammaproteobacteria bacterium RIFCSPHIGHO2_12_FULL_63_22]